MHSRLKILPGPLVPVYLCREGPPRSLVHQRASNARSGERRQFREVVCGSPRTAGLPPSSADAVLPLKKSSVRSSLIRRLRTPTLSEQTLSRVLEKERLSCGLERSQLLSRNQYFKSKSLVHTNHLILSSTLAVHGDHPDGSTARRLQFSPPGIHSRGSAPMPGVPSCKHPVRFWFLARVVSHRTQGEVIPRHAMTCSPTPLHSVLGRREGPSQGNPFILHTCSFMTHVFLLFTWLKNE